jgi:23S rRNA (uracil1939-C5)-methyltransferase
MLGAVSTPTTPTTPTTRPPKPARGAELELTVDALAFGGNGVARREDGFVVFVQGAVPGDRVKARITRPKRDYAEAIAVELLDPSPERIPPLAAHPGVPWQVLPYERQLEIKAAQVDDALKRIGRLEGYELEPIVPAVEQWRYRNRLEYSFGQDPSGALVYGFHAPGQWERIVPFDDCLIASERSNEVSRAVLEWCRAQGLTAYDRATREGFLRNLVVREGRRTGQIQVRLVTMPGKLDRDAFADAIDCEGLLWTQFDGVGETTARGDTELVAGREFYEEELSGLTLRISPHAFFQTNTEMAERLYALAGEYAALKGFERVYDLYCGGWS